VNWQREISLRDLDDSAVLEATCLRCTYMWLQSPVQLLIKVSHRDVKLCEVADNLACPRPGCRHVGVRLALIKKQDTSGFVGGMP
jgi:hypothetical protein